MPWFDALCAIQAWCGKIFGKATMAAPAARQQRPELRIKRPAEPVLGPPAEARAAWLEVESFSAVTCESPCLNMRWFLVSSVGDGTGAWRDRHPVPIRPEIGWRSAAS
jgi:hypothetical protein